MYRTETDSVVLPVDRGCRSPGRLAFQYNVVAGWNASARTVVEDVVFEEQLLREGVSQCRGTGLAQDCNQSKQPTLDM